MSRNIACIVCSYEYNQAMLHLCLKSLRKHSPNCDIHFFGHGYTQQNKNQLNGKFGLHFSDLTDSEWVGREGSCVIEKTGEIRAEPGDNFLNLNADLIFKDDPFKVFEKDFDIILTSRYYPFRYPVNGGVWGGKYNENTKKFLDFFSNQVGNPTCTPLLLFNRLESNRKNWYLSQDFLCVWFMISQLKSDGKISVPWQKNKEVLEALYKAELPFKVRMYDAGPKYNYAPATILGTRDEIVADVREKLNDAQTKIIHLKGMLHSNKYLARLGLYKTGWAQRLMQILKKDRKRGQRPFFETGGRE